MVQPYKSTPIFDETTLPEGLRREHRTKAGVWGVIRVLQGRLKLTWLDTGEERILAPSRPGLIAPEQPHLVEPVGQMRMRVDFYDQEPAMRPAPSAEPTRREDIVAARVAETGIDEAMIRTLVHRFYGDVREDPVLGPIFGAKVEDWDDHLERLCGFWSSVALMTGRYGGKPMQVHMRLDVDLDRGHFERWLSLFRVAAAEVCTPAAAAFFVERAERIAESLQLGIAVAREQRVA
jgi:hemoglobin